ncbi:MAG: hypothetical protein QGG64_17495 [Candidatus Latescibacteria bacterium]|nr:hypothetical protein [Candidatus Latescibacterota bacterium]
MNICNLKILCFLCALILGASNNTPAQSSETDTSKTMKEEKPDSTSLVFPDSTSTVFLERWKKIQTVLKKRAYETQQTRTSGGVRGDEAQDNVTDVLYKPVLNAPHLLNIRNASVQLQNIIKANPSSKEVPELWFLTAQCLEKLSESKQANAIYLKLIEKYSKTEYAKLAQEKIKPEK